MNICFISGGFKSNGGIGRVTSMLINEMSTDNDKQIWALSYCYNKQDNLYFLAPNVRDDFLLHKKKNMRMALLTGATHDLRRYIKNNKIDVLVACGTLYFIISMMATRGLKTKCVCWEHYNANNIRGYPFQRISRLAAAKLADLLVVLTKHDYQEYQKRYAPKNMIQIYNPVDHCFTSRSIAYNATSKKIISVGRLSYQKNFQLLIEIATGVLKKHPDWSWDIFGDGDERTVLEELIQKNNMDGRVTLKGQVNDLYCRYPEYSFMVMTSRFEGFPMALLEGGANGLPLVSFDIKTGPNEIIMHGENGYLISPFEIDTMKSYINKMINNPELRRNMSEKAADKCREFEIRHIVNYWRRSLNSLVEGRGD